MKILMLGNSYTYFFWFNQCLCSSSISHITTIVGSIIRVLSISVFTMTHP